MRTERRDSEAAHPGRPVRVAIVLSAGLDARGGIGRVMTYLTRALAERRPEINVSVHRSRLSERGLLRHATAPLALAAFAAALVQGRIDVAHVNVAPRGSTWRKMLFAAVARRLGVPVLLHLHGSGYDHFFAALAPARQARVRAFFASAAAVVALSEHWRRFLLTEVGLPPERVAVIPNGVPLATPAAPHGENAPLLVFLGLVGERKGIDVFLQALAELRRRGMDWRARVAGNGEVEAASEQARALGIADATDFLGWVDEAAADRLLREADVFVLPSRAENQPVSILEAMARALPVVATRVGAIPEQVVEGQTGLLVGPGDVQALAEALATLITSAELRRRLGEAGRRRFEARFSVAACADSFANLYCSLA